MVQKSWLITASSRGFGRSLEGGRVRTAYPPATPRNDHDRRDLTRREFLEKALKTGSVFGIGISVLGEQRPAGGGEAMQATDISLETTINLTVNGARRAITVDVRTSLLDMLRERLQLTGTKKGCDHGQCGACTVHVNGRRVNSCLTLAVMHDGAEITTIEGLGTPDELHPMQAAFVACDGYQCGYCTSGQIMSAVALLKEPCGPDDAAVKELMSGNICRCGAYANIIAAVQQARKGA